MRATLPLSVGLCVVLITAACGGGQPQPVVPAVDSAAIRDSIMQAQAAAERARQDSIQRAQAEAERLRQMEEERSRREAAERETAAVREMIARRVHYDFDRSNIRPGDDTRILEQKLAILQANPALRIQIIGHCDERGTDEYNMALGNRRAISARMFLTNRGISESRITVRSRGEEDPIDTGRNEAAWERNRRSEYLITGGGATLVRPRM